MIMTRLRDESALARTPGAGPTIGAALTTVACVLVAHAARAAIVASATTAVIVLSAVRWIGDICRCSVSRPDPSSGAREDRSSRPHRREDGWPRRRDLRGPV